MATATTYATLLEDVPGYVERAFSSSTDPKAYAYLPRAINLAERRIARDLKIQGLQQTVTTTLSSGVSVYEKPDRWRQTISMSFGSGTGNQTWAPLYPRTFEYIRAYWPDATQSATPKFYADYDLTHWWIGPTPDQAYPVEILYYQLPPLLDAANQSNWATNYAPDLLLYGVIAEFALYCKDYDAKQTFEAEYGRVMGSLTKEDMKKIIDRTTTRDSA